MKQDKAAYAQQFSKRYPVGKFKPTVKTDVIDYAIYTLEYIGSTDLIHSLARDLFVFKGVHERAGFENLNTPTYAIHSVFTQATRTENYDLLDYILSDKVLLRLAKLQYKKADWFDTLCYSYTIGQPKMLEWLIFEKDLPYKSSIKEIAEKEKYKSVKELFDKRELNRKISQKLPPKNTPKQKVNKI